DHVGDLGNQDLIPAVFLLHDLGAAPQGDFAAAGGVGRPDARPAHDDAAGGEVGAFDVFHQTRQIDFGVVHQGAHTAHHFPQVVGRNVGVHTNGDALAAVHQQVGEAAGQHVGFFFGFVKVGVPVHGFLLDVGEHLAGDLGHTGFGITVGSRGVAVHG